MTERKQIYRCNVCGNIVEVLHAGGGELVCCGQPMELLAEKTADAGKEKHVPLIEKTDEKMKVKVGSVQHPMEENHYIEWIEIITADEICRKFLKPGDVPEAIFEFKISADVKKVDAREFCSVHGLWQNSIEEEGNNKKEVIEMGIGQGRGAGGPRQGLGRGGAPTKCVCPQCGHEATKVRGTPCHSMKCPKCGVPLVGK